LLTAPFIVLEARMRVYSWYKCKNLLAVNISEIVRVNITGNVRLAGAARWANSVSFARRLAA